MEVRIKMQRDPNTLENSAVEHKMKSSKDKHKVLRNREEKKVQIQNGRYRSW